jgi:hypothetical protein
VNRPRSLKEKLVLFAAAVALVAAYFAVSTFLYWYGAREIPPRVNADGTTDHVLITSFGKKFPRYYWVLRLPNNLAVKTSKTEDVGTVSLNGGPSITFHERANQYLELYFDGETFRPLTQAEYNATTSAAAKKSVVEVHLESFPALTDYNARVLEAKKYCDEVSSGRQDVKIFKFNPAKVPKDQHFHCLVHPVSAGDLATAYLVADDAGSIIAEITCRTGENYRNDPDCSGKVKFQNNRNAHLFFRQKALPSEQFPEFLKALRAFTEGSTIRTGELPSRARFQFEQERQ